MRPDAPALSVDVVVPTYRRPLLLDRCLRALTAQERPADRVLVVARDEDFDAHAVIDAHLGPLPGLERITVAEPGVLAAMAAGVARSTGDVLAFTDDDAAPRPDWIAMLIEHLGDPTVGAVGGRDVIPGQETPLTADVGRLRRSGRLSGMHHLGTGPPRDVDVLKGVNMAFRAEAFALPAPGVLRGSGAQVDFEIITCAWAKRQGWRVVYDPAIQVDHEAAGRSGTDQRVKPAPSAVADAAFNSLIAASAVGGPALARHAAYGLTVGTRDRPGFVRALVALTRGEEEVWSRLRPALSGRLAALTAACRVSSDPVRTAAELRDGPKQRPQVTLVAHDIHDGGGMERAHAELVRALHADFDLTVVSATLADDLRPLVRWHRIRVPQRPFLAKFLIFFIRAGLAVARERRGLLHTLGAIIPNRADLASLHFCHAGFRRATGALTSADTPLLRRMNSGASRLAALLAERWCYRPGRLSAIAAVSEGVRRESERHFPGVPVAVTPNGVDVVQFAPDQRARLETRRAAAIGGETCVALFVGGDWDRKGLTLVLEAIAKARADDADIVLWVVGAGDEIRFASLATDLSIQAAVTFFGRQANTASFYQAADVLVLPSAYETFSLVCFEAAACGLPLVIPPLSGACDLVGDDEAGIVIDRDAHSIASALRALATDPARRIAMGREARLRSLAFTWQASTEAVTDLYGDLLLSRVPS